MNNEVHRRKRNVQTKIKKAKEALDKAKNDVKMLLDKLEIVKQRIESGGREDPMPGRGHRLCVLGHEVPVGVEECLLGGNVDLHLAYTEATILHAERESVPMVPTEDHRRAFVGDGLSGSLGESGELL